MLTCVSLTPTAAGMPKSILVYIPLGHAGLYHPLVSMIMSYEVLHSFFLF